MTSSDNQQTRHKPAVNVDELPVQKGSTYPPALGVRSEARIKRRMGDAFGLTQFGVNHIVLVPGCESALRHWHANEDELVYVLSGSPTLVTSDGEQPLTPGMCIGFKGGCPDGHHIVNKSDADVELLEIGTRMPNDPCFYPDDDLLWIEEPGGQVAAKKSGERYI